MIIKTGIVERFSLKELKLTILTGSGCHLCDEMKEAIGSVSTQIPVTLESIDIATDRALLRKYRMEIPVLLYNDEEIARHRISKNELREKLGKLQQAERPNTERGRSPV